MPTRCGWVTDDPLYLAYHDDEWGVPLREDAKLFELLLLEGAQAGLAWITILRKREGYRRAFDGFDAEKIAAYTDADRERLRADAGIVRNRLKIDAFITNSRLYLELRERESFSDFLWSFVGGEPIQNAWPDLASMPATSPESDAMAKELKKRGFKFIGSTICYAFMQAAGLVNDHTLDCYRHAPVAALAR